MSSPLSRSALARTSRRLRSTWAGRRCVAWLMAHGYPTRAPNGRRADLAAAALTHDASPPEVRAATTTLLVDLFFDLVELAGVQRFVEAGAKEASASVRASRTPGVTSVTAFEANPYTYRRFAAKLGDLPLRYEHLALTDAPGEATFRVLLTSDGRPSSNGRGSLLERAGYEPGFEEVTVRAVTLDGYFADEGPLRTAMWIDVEGASGPVLRGAKMLLADTDVVIIEVEEQQVWSGDHWLRPAIVAYLHDHGLRPVARDLQSRFQHNIVFVRTSLLDRADIVCRLDRWARAITAAGA